MIYNIEDDDYNSTAFRTSQWANPFNNKFKITILPTIIFFEEQDE